MNPLHLGEREVCFNNYKKILDNGDWIGNQVKAGVFSITKHIIFLILKIVMNNLLEMLHQNVPKGHKSTLGTTHPLAMKDYFIQRTI